MCDGEIEIGLAFGQSREAQLCRGFQIDQIQIARRQLSAGAHRLQGLTMAAQPHQDGDPAKSAFDDRGQECHHVIQKRKRFGGFVPAVEERRKRDLRHRILLIKRQRLPCVLLGARQIACLQTDP